MLPTRAMFQQLAALVERVAVEPAVGQHKVGAMGMLLVIVCPYVGPSRLDR